MTSKKNEMKLLLMCGRPCFIDSGILRLDRYRGNGCRQAGCGNSRWGVLDIIIEDGVSGLLVPCKDSKAMARAILLLLSDHDKAEQIGHAAKQRVAEKFTIEKQVASVQILYDKILGIRRE